MPPSPSRRVPSKSRQNTLNERIFASLSASQGDVEPNADMYCYITKNIPEDPVVALDGHIYSKAALTAYMQQNPDTSPMGKKWPETSGPWVPKCRFVARVVKPANRIIQGDENEFCPICHLQPLKAREKYAQRRKEVLALQKFVERVVATDFSDDPAVEALKTTARKILRDGADHALSREDPALTGRDGDRSPTRERTRKDDAKMRRKRSRKIVPLEVEDDSDQSFDSSKDSKKKLNSELDNDQDLPTPSLTARGISTNWGYTGVLSSIQKAGKNVSKSLNSSKFFNPKAEQKEEDCTSPTAGNDHTGHHHDHSHRRSRHHNLTSAAGLSIDTGFGDSSRIASFNDALEPTDRQKVRESSSDEMNDSPRGLSSLVSSDENLLAFTALS